MVGVSVVGVPTPLNVVGNNGGSQMCVHLQCEFYTNLKTFYKPFVFVFSMPTSNVSFYLNLSYCDMLKVVILP